MMKHKFIAASMMLALSTPIFADDDLRRHERMIGHLDTDGDGLISLEEFRRPGDRMIKEADQDGDGAVSLEELKVHREQMRQEHHERMQEQMAEHEAKMDEMFQSMDTDGNGAVTPEEARQAAFNHMDKNGDGYLSSDELRPPRHARGQREGFRPHHGGPHEDPAE